MNPLQSCEDPTNISLTYLMQKFYDVLFCIRPKKNQKMLGSSNRSAGSAGPALGKGRHLELCELFDAPEDLLQRELYKALAELIDVGALEPGR